METTTAETLEEKNTDTSVPKLPPKQDAEVGVPEEVKGASEVPESDKNVTGDKELSWENIAAEITADDGEENKTQAEPIVEPNVETKEAESGEAEETVIINDVTEEKIVTETEVADSDEPQNESTESVAPEQESEGNESVAEPEPEATVAETIVETTVEEITEENIETVPVPEVIEESVEEVPLPADPAVEITREKSKPEGEIEITELKPEEVAEETVEEIEYTVVEAEEVETNEIIEEHIAQTNSQAVAETVVIINPDQTQTEIRIEQIEDGDKSDENSQTYTEEIYLVTKDNESVDDPAPVEEEKAESPPKPKKQRGRKPISDIPLHVLGRDITKPSEGVSNGGRTMPKPRLGVKVPYRNLTSQIVSKQEIEKEIMERFKLKQEQNATNSGDILFARKLTQRLAKKLIPSEKEKDVKPQIEEASSSIQNEKSEIKNNSDLIAILEGDGDDIELTKQKQEEEKKELVKKSEKEIALQQLKELPGKNKVFKSRSEEEKEETKVSSPQKEAPKPKVVPTAPTPKKEEKKSQMDVEPRLKTGMVVKTYTRKRKSTEEPIPPPKKAVVSSIPVKTEDGSASGSVYVTKSSRIIKRKVIWDPDEIPVKSPLKSPKMEPGVKPPPVKPVEKKEVDKSQEKKISSPVKKVIVKTSPIKKPKRLTEVDKLLMDEGAVNMLYDVKTNDDTSPDKFKKKNKSVISLDKAHKELMSKTNVIKNDLQQNTNKEVQKSLRKKDVASPPKKEVKKEPSPSGVTRKKSKDSVRSSAHSPPSSPPYNAAEASRIIRRHSSSSFSSNDELDDDSGEEKVTKKKSAVASESPKKKLRKISDAKPTKEVAKNNNNTVTEPKVNHVDKTSTQDKSFTLTKKNKLVTIKLLSVDSKCYLTNQVLKDLISSLKDLSKDDDCHVVSITSDSNESFCEGLDYSLLTAENDDSARKKKATELASLVKEFLRCLLNFPKVLVAGIQGDCVGLGVTMLPLFDMVIASDISTFSTPYARLGCVPEAGFLLTVPYLGSNGLASELLYTSQIIKADDAFRRGLVTRLCWPEKYQQELRSMLSQVANQSQQSIVATKQQLRQNILQSTESALNSVSKVLVEHWTSPECLKNFSK